MCLNDPSSVTIPGADAKMSQPCKDMLDQRHRPFFECFLYSETAVRTQKVESCNESTYEKHGVVSIEETIGHARSHLTSSSSIRMRINSGMASLGWVCMSSRSKTGYSESRRGEAYIVELDGDICSATCHVSRVNKVKGLDAQSGNSVIAFPRFLKRRMMSARLAAVQKLAKEAEVSNTLSCKQSEKNDILLLLQPQFFADCTRQSSATVDLCREEPGAYMFCNIWSQLEKESDRKG